MVDAFLEYLTVFRARLGATNIILGLTAFSHLQEETLLRKARKILESRVALTLADSDCAFVFTYLKDKGLISESQSAAGRYEGFALSKQRNEWQATDKRGRNIKSLPVFQTDIWMANTDIRSTVGVPTPDNAKEIVDLTFQLRLLSRGKGTWTSAGHLIQCLRRAHVEQQGTATSDNPFLLYADAAAFLRQIIDIDGFMLRELLRAMIKKSSGSSGGFLTRDDVVKEFDVVVAKAVESLGGHFPNTVIYKAKQFRKQIDNTAKKRARQSRAPGVLEHRVAPRLEWLVDLGYLSKEGLPKNGFSYRVEAAALSLLNDLDKYLGCTHWAENVAISQWASNPIWKHLKPDVGRRNGVQSLLDAYRLLQRPIGPSPLNDVVFVSALFSEAKSFDEMEAEVLRFARATEGINLSGSRLHRGPQNIFISDKVAQRRA